jgi:hypothetical protein
MRLPLIVLFLPHVALAHGTSKSFAEWRLTARRAELRITFGGHDVAASVPGLDANEDRQLTRSELEARLEVVRRRTIDHTVLAAPAPCAAESSMVDAIGDPVVTEISVRIRYACRDRIERAHFEFHQLPELEPPHVTVGTILAGKTVAQHVFTKEAPAFDLDVELPSLAEELATAALAGLRALVLPATLLFLLGAILFERPRSGALIVGLWTVAYQAGAALYDGMGLLDELARALSVAAVGLELALRKSEAMPKWKLALVPALAFLHGSNVAPVEDTVARAACILAQSAAALVAFAAAAGVGAIAGARAAAYRRPVGIAWLCGAGALTALAFR